MNYQFNLLRVTRNKVLKTIEGLDLATLNKTPEGFNNNLAWNLGHIIATQQLLCYGLSGNEMLLENDFISRYRKGSKPDTDIDETELDFIKSQMIILIDKIEDDFQNQLFPNFKEYTTSYNATLTSIDDAIIFNNLHEAMHLGYMIALKKVLGV